MGVAAVLVRSLTSVPQIAAAAPLSAFSGSACCLGTALRCKHSAQVVEPLIWYCTSCTTPEPLISPSNQIEVGVIFTRPTATRGSQVGVAAGERLATTCPSG